MVAEILKPTVQEIQKDVIELLEQISAITSGRLPAEEKEAIGW